MPETVPLGAGAVMATVGGVVSGGVGDGDGHRRRGCGVAGGVAGAAVSVWVPLATVVVFHETL